MNLLRMDYVRDTLAKYSPGDLPGYSLDLLPKAIRDQFEGNQSIGYENQYEVLDVGCGGGLLSESLARLKEVRQVRGIDLTSDVLEVAKDHMKKDPILKSKLDYRLMGIDQVPENEKYDIVTLFEMLEHVPRPAEVLDAALKRVKPGGWVFISTINRTPIAYFTTIFMGEDVLRIVPKGTHTYDKYINEQELRDFFSDKSDWDVVRSDGCFFMPFLDWQLTSNRSIGNYFLVARRRL
ncbi:hexaprenyldihydroxybenzoate methyltransferase [Sugiyamaella lignohabitans]|uniref:Hexaprenyldihydroxybenzoate methyltransferase n=1 Tax=Sugiyamaella lignohabitans TaxID=796027 RepID=A0A167ENB4_9ASCO|nr:hexaprenyldihydroxybenzoate methyltransferase [Sugiyamaella lignohabitans]ANB14275.1 hexaprenyldihydroxybenzoate methyltransferase [Sugiyamaella lignohabitans]